MPGSWRPWTSWRSCTANSMSLKPPRPRLISRSVRPRFDTSSSARAFIIRTSRTASGSSRSGHTWGAAASMKTRPSSASPATGRALMRAWNSQVDAHFSQ